MWSLWPSNAHVHRNTDTLQPTTWTVEEKWRKVWDKVKCVWTCFDLYGELKSGAGKEVRNKNAVYRSKKNVFLKCWTEGYCTYLHIIHIWFILCSSCSWDCGIIHSCCNMIMNWSVILFGLFFRHKLFFLEKFAIHMQTCLCRSVCPGCWTWWRCSPRWKGVHAANHRHGTAVASDNPPRHRGGQLWWIPT